MIPLIIISFFIIATYCIPGYLVYGGYVFNSRYINKRLKECRNTAWINSLDRDIICLDLDSNEYISKYSFFLLTKWYINGESYKKRIWRWSKLSKDLDTFYNSLKDTEYTLKTLQ